MQLFQPLHQRSPVVDNMQVTAGQRPTLSCKPVCQQGQQQDKLQVGGLPAWCGNVTRCMLQWTLMTQLSVVRYMPLLDVGAMLLDDAVTASFTSMTCFTVCGPASCVAGQDESLLYQKDSVRAHPASINSPEGDRSPSSTADTSREACVTALTLSPCLADNTGPGSAACGPSGCCRETLVLTSAAADSWVRRTSAESAAQLRCLNQTPFCVQVLLQPDGFTSLSTQIVQFVYRHAHHDNAG